MLCSSLWLRSWLRFWLWCSLQRALFIIAPPLLAALLAVVLTAACWLQLASLKAGSPADAVHVAELEGQLAELKALWQNSVDSGLQIARKLREAQADAAKHAAR